MRGAMPILMMTTALLGPGLTGPGQAEDRALVIGISDYIDPRIADLAGSENDGRRFALRLETRYGFSPGQVKTLFSRQATRAAIQTAWRDWLVQGTQPGDRVVFFYSGHGSQRPDADGDEDDGWDELLCAVDYDPSTQRNGLVDDELRAMLQELSGRHVTVVIDCCHSGTMTKEALPPEAAAKFIPTPASLPPPPASGPPGAGSGLIDEPQADHVLFTACLAGQTAADANFIESEGKVRHGAFTYYFCQGLEGAADADGDGLVSNQEALDFALRRLRSSAQGFQQTPQLRTRAALFKAPIFGSVVAAPAEPGRADAARAAPGSEPFVGTAPAAGHRWAILIGIGDYPHLPKLRYAAADCRLLERVLVGQAGFDPHRVLKITDQDGAAETAPTRARLLGLLDQWLAQPEPADLVLVFFSGHGLDQQGASYLAPLDCDGRDLAASAISTAGVIDRLTRCRAAWKVLLLDACHSGSGMSPPLWEALSRPGNDPRLVTLASCGLQERSHEDPILRHGTFTYYLAEALGGQADAQEPARLSPEQSIGNRDGRVTLTEAYEYTYDRVVDWAGRHGVSQSPKFIGQFHGNLVMAWTGGVGAAATAPGAVSPTVALKLADLEPARPPGLCRLPSGLIPEPGAPVDPVSGLARRVRRARDGATMTLVPAGLFTMGTRPDQIDAVFRAFPELKAEPLALQDERPEHVVFLSAFYIDLTEVTVGQFERFVQATGYRTTAERGFEYASQPVPPGAIVDDGRGQAAYRAGACWRQPDGPGSGTRADDPVGAVSWFDAQAFAQWVGGQLPTEAQWEKAARGTDGRLFPWGDGWEAGRANVGRLDPATGALVGDAADGFLRWSPVGAFPQAASPYGCLDMSGNMWEWCQDRYGPRYYQWRPAEWRDPSGPRSGDLRVLRGGSWAYLPGWARGAARWRGLPQVPYAAHGFRVVVVPARADRTSSGREDVR